MTYKTTSMVRLELILASLKTLESARDSTFIFALQGVCFCAQAFHTFTHLLDTANTVLSGSDVTGLIAFALPFSHDRYTLSLKQLVTGGIIQDVAGNGVITTVYGVTQRVAQTNLFILIMRRK